MVSRSTTLSLSVLFFFAFFSQSESDTPKVSLELYYESLCPESANFIVNSLPKIFTNNLTPIVDVKFVPWGNAKLRPNHTFTCQHGPNECFLNTVEACAIDTWPERSKHFLFIHCVEDFVHRRKASEWKSCFEKLNLDSKPIGQCYHSEHGTKLELQYAAETNALEPPHKYVPWVVVNGEPLYEDFENFISYICKAYKGTDKPKSCTKVSYLAEVKARPKHSVCYKEREEPTWGEMSSIVSSWLHKMMNPGGRI